MEVVDVVAQYAAVLRRLSADPAGLDGPDRIELVRDLNRLRTWLDARETELLSVIHHERDDVDVGARDLTQLSQQQANVGYGEAKRRELRAMWTGDVPQLREALTAGEISTAQVDEFCLLAERLTPDRRDSLRSAVDELVADVAEMTPARTRKRLSEFEATLEADDGEKRLAAQRAANSIRLPKQPDGTTAIVGQLDPISAEYVSNALDAKVTEIWRREGSGRGDMTPPERVLGNDHRRATALVELIRAGAGADPGSRGRSEIIVLIDHQTLLGELSLSPTVKLSSGGHIPAAEARRLACDANIIPVVMGGASRPIDVGRGARLATSAQRAALRSAHDSCCVAGCDVPFDWCEIHHVTWWRHGGRSDLDNLVPVCSKHHHLVHDDRWVLTIDAERVGRLTERRPEPAGALSRNGDARPARPRRRSAPTRSTRSAGSTAADPPSTASQRTHPMRC